MINFFSGCTKVSDGCKNCYAEARDARMMQEKISHWGKGAPRLKHTGAVKQALAMNRRPMICDHCGEADTVDNRMSHITSCPNHDCPSNIHEHVESSFHRRRIFSLSLGDWLDAEVPIEWLAEMLDTIRQCDQVVWILCTKRPQNFTSRLNGVLEWAKIDLGEPHWIKEWLYGRPPKNIILLASVENQAMADLRIPQLLAIPAACRGLSLEPLFESVDLGLIGTVPKDISPSYQLVGSMISWLIIGGESGPYARPFNEDWARSLVNQGKSAGVPVFMKQYGSNPVYTASNLQLHPSAASDPKMWISLRSSSHHPFPIHAKKGDVLSEWSTDLRVQQFPVGF